ncbi:MAG: hypothetical protein ACE5EV_09165, partial [Gaiellales bacterium]
SISAVSAGPKGIVAVGTAPTGAAAWYSVDGLSWRRAVAPSSWRYRNCEGLRPVLHDVVATTEEFVAVGTECAPKRRRGIGAAVWTSTDGLLWTRAARGFDRVLWSVTEHDGRLYATAGSAIWVSGDARDWQPVFETDASLSLDMITSVGRRVFAAGGGWSRERGHRAVILVSSDGRDWAPAEIQGDRFGSIAGIAAFEGGYVAVGQSDVTAAAWTSPDGMVWSRVPHLPDDAPRGHASDLSAVATLGGDEVVAVLNADVGRARLIGTIDGSTWEVLFATPDATSDDGYYRATDIAALPGRTLVVGGFEDPPRGVSAAVWSDPAPAAVAPDGRYAVACLGRPVDLLMLLEMSPAGRLDCYGERELTFRALIKRHDSGFPEFASQPYWLTLGEGGALALPVDSHPGATMSLLLHSRPRPADRVLWPYGQWAIVRGHFDDRAARKCPEEDRQQCREAFVVTSVKRTGDRIDRRSTSHMP